MISELIKVLTEHTEVTLKSIFKLFKKLLNNWYNV